MRRILHLALHDLRLTVRDRMALFWMLLMPVALMWLFGQMGGGGSAIPKVRLTLVDEDGGWLARAFVEQLRVPALDLVEKTAAAAPGEERRIRTLVIPKGFTQRVLEGRQQKLHIDLDEKTRAEFDRAANVYVVRAIARTLAILSEMSVDDGEMNGTRFAALAAEPPRVLLEVTTGGAGRPVPRGLAQSVPGILTMTVLMMTVIYGGVFLTLEKRDGTLRRQAAGPIGPTGLLAGKLLGRLLVAGTQTLLLLVAGRLIFGLDFGSSPAGLAILLASYAFCAAGLATLCGAVFRTPEQASAIGWLAAMVMSALGGCWWPSEIVPRWLWHAAHVFPTAWAMDAFHALISFGRGIEAVLLPAGILLAFGVGFTLLGSRRLRLEGA